MNSAYALLAEQRQQAALKFVDTKDAYDRFRENENRLYVWLRKQRKERGFEHAWRSAGNLCCRTSRTLQTLKCKFLENVIY